MNARALVAAPSKPTASGGAVRLINRVDVLQQLLAAVAAVPEGVKLSLPQLRDALVSQADVLAGLQTLIIAGELDPESLRPVEKKVAPSPGSASPSPPSPPTGEGPPSGAALAAELDALIAKHGLLKSSVAIHAGNGATGWIEALRRSNPRPKSIERIRAFLADPPLDKLQPKRRAPTVAPPAPPPVVPEPPVIKIPLGRKSRAYCQQPSNCTAPPRGSCRLCQPRTTGASRDPTVSEARRSVAFRKRSTVEAERLLDRNPEATVGRNAGVSTALHALKEQRENEARQADPVEQAKLALQRRGLSVYSAAIHGGRKDRFMVSGQRDPDTGRLKELTPAELLDLAESKTGMSFRRVA